MCMCMCVSVYVYVCLFVCVCVCTCVCVRGIQNRNWEGEEGSSHGDDLVHRFRIKRKYDNMDEQKKRCGQMRGEKTQMSSMLQKK